MEVLILKELTLHQNCAKWHAGVKVFAKHLRAHQTDSVSEPRIEGISHTTSRTSGIRVSAVSLGKALLAFLSPILYSYLNQLARLHFPFQGQSRSSSHFPGGRGSFRHLAQSELIGRLFACLRDVVYGC